MKNVITGSRRQKETLATQAKDKTITKSTANDL